VLGPHQGEDLQEEEGLPHMEVQLEEDIPQLEGDTHYLDGSPHGVVVAWRVGS